MRIAYIFGLILLLACVSCRERVTTREFDEHEHQIFLAYCTNDIHAAEQVLLGDLKNIQKYKNDHLPGIDFDSAESTIHERLFLIYRKLHETNKMEIEFEQNNECIARSRQHWKLPPVHAGSYESLAEAMNKLERNANVRWKTNLDSITQKSR